MESFASDLKCSLKRCESKMQELLGYFPLGFIQLLHTLFLGSTFLVWALESPVK